jgi:voltage-gated potassium channel
LLYFHGANKSSFYPITLEGRAVAVVLMTAGVGLFATFTAFISNVFLESTNKKHESEITELIGEERLLRERLDSMANEQRKISLKKEEP